MMRFAFKRRCVSGLLSGILMVGLAGCIALPLASDPEPFDVSVPDVDPVEFAADGPLKNSDPQTLISDFLLASAAGTNDDFATARLFLTAASQQTWAPDDEALVYDTASSPSISIKGDEGSGTLTATVTVPAVASVNSEGVMTRSEDSMISSTFNLVQEGGQWRIDSPEDAFIVSQTAFSAAYEQANLYFPATTGDALVADPRWYPSRRLASHLLSGLIAGPSQTIEAAVTNAIPGGTTFPAQGVEISDQIAKVDLSAPTVGEGTPRQLLAWEVTETLLQDSQISAVDLSLSGASLEGIETPSLPTYSLDTRIALQAGRIGSLAGSTLTAFDLPISPASSASYPAVSPINRDVVAWREGNSLVVSASGAQGAHSSVDVGSGNETGAPSIDRFGWVWSPASTSGPIIATTPDGQVGSVPINETGVVSVFRVAISPDGARALVLSGTPSNATAWMFAVARDSSGVPLGLEDGQAILGIHGQITDLSWAGSSSYVVVRSAESSADSGDMELDEVAIGGFVSQSEVPDQPLAVSAGQTTTNVCVKARSGSVTCRTGALWQAMPAAFADVRFPG